MGGRRSDRSGAWRIEDTRRLVSYMLQYGDFPMVLDADALNIIAADENLKQLLGKNHVLTPHMGEMSRLIAQSSQPDLPVDMPACARSFSDRFGCVLVLKDACTLVSGGDQLYVNACGNSGMATGGSGDVLSGVIGALLAGGQLTGFEAASYGVLMHALAGDRAGGRIRRKSRYGF
ncbi:MAG: ADP/ATP-dependent (S)-NAD(P)H-hydrate dehydratase [Lachnospiraceae bacterium]